MGLIRSHSVFVIGAFCLVLGGSLYATHYQHKDTNYPPNALPHLRP